MTLTWKKGEARILIWRGQDKNKYSSLRKIVKKFLKTMFKYIPRDFMLFWCKKIKYVFDNKLSFCQLSIEQWVISMASSIFTNTTSSTSSLIINGWKLERLQTNSISITNNTLIIHCLIAMFNNFWWAFNSF